MSRMKAIFTHEAYQEPGLDGKGVSDVFNLAVDLVLKDREGGESGSHSTNAPKGKKKKKDGACLLL